MFTAPCWIHDTENSGCSGARGDIRSHTDVSSFCSTHHYDWTEWPFNAGVPWGRSWSFPSASHRLCPARPQQSSDRFPSGPPDGRQRDIHFKTRCFSSRWLHLVLRPPCSPSTIMEELHSLLFLLDGNNLLIKCLYWLVSWWDAVVAPLQDARSSREREETITCRNPGTTDSWWIVGKTACWPNKVSQVWCCLIRLVFTDHEFISSLATKLDNWILRNLTLLTKHLLRLTNF